LSFSLFSYDRLSKKPLLFKSFIGLTVQEFDDIYDKEMTKRYAKQKIKRLSKRKNRKRSIGAGRHFKLDVKDRVVMLSVYYRRFSVSVNQVIIITIFEKTSGSAIVFLL